MRGASTCRFDAKIARFDAGNTTLLVANTALHPTCAALLAARASAQVVAAELLLGSARFLRLRREIDIMPHATPLLQ